MKNIKSFENYIVTKSGQIYSNRHVLKPVLTTKGYHQVSLCKNGKAYTKHVHKLVAEAFIPNPENKPQINHKNCIKTDNRVENLEWCTAQENMQHAKENNLIKRLYGQDNHMYNKLVSKDTREKISIASVQSWGITREKRILALTQSQNRKDVKDKKSQSMKGKNLGDKNGMSGKFGKLNPNSKRIIGIINNVDFVCFYSAVDAVKWLNLKVSANIVRSIKYKKNAGVHPELNLPIKWRYYEKD